MSKKKKHYGIPEVENILPKTTLPIWDMHCHLDMTVHFVEDIQKDVKERHPDYPEVHIPTLQELVSISQKANVGGVIHCACEIDDIDNISNVLDSLSAKDSNFGVLGAAAIHPNEAALHQKITDPSPDGLVPEMQERHYKYSLEDALQITYDKIKQDNRIKIIGESGLDYFRTSERGRVAQKNSLREHIILAKELNLPLQLHDRLAHRDIIEVLDKEGAPEIVLFHSFSGDQEFAKECIRRGFYGSFSGPLTFKNTEDLSAAFLEYWQFAPQLILSETDSPYLTAAPNRGRPNAPAFMADSIVKMSEIAGVDLLEMC
ncbi:MAG: TatD family hydrolase, partial [Candidatus Ancillula sp.]|nr:TatD family hydrolase [Candidatus Ancillula sp.]